MNFHWMTRLAARGVIVAATWGLAGGCTASYAVPGRGAQMSAFGAASRAEQTDNPIATTMTKRPLATLPTAIAVVRVQDPSYRAEDVDTYGSGAYTVVTTRTVEEADGKDQAAELAKLPMVSGIAPINRLLLPAELHSDLELRQAAAALHADMLLIYTLDTTFKVEDVAAPLTVVTLGLSPNQQARVVTTASAVLLDTRNGYLYGMAEATERDNQLASGWTSQAAVDQTRRRVEAKAFQKLVKNLQVTWAGVVRNLQGTERAMQVVPR